jgi:choice-of-anchor B domain-containing protein
MRRKHSLGLAVLALTAVPALAEDDPATFTASQRALLETPHELSTDQPLHLIPCISGFAAGFPCSNVDLLESFPAATIGGGTGNDIWGWTDPKSGREFAIAGLSTGTAFIEITDPGASVHLGFLPTHSSSSLWRDIKVYQHYAYIVSEATNHGLQVFDLNRLLNVVGPPVTFTEDAHYAEFGRAHNVVINEESGFLFAVGSRQGTTQCSAGLHMVDIRTPLSPTFAGCFSADGYTHDAQCIVYDGPDADHTGDEICFNSNEDTLTIVDVTTKASPAQLSRTPYAGSGYTHQGWLTEDRQYFLIDDELDEQNFGHTTRTYVWNVSNLEAPVLVGHHAAANPVIDHNQYVRGNFVFQANYQGGLRILRIDDLAQAALTEVGYFDLYPQSNTASFNGAWSVYPYFPSGTVVLNGIEQGMFVLRPNLCTPPATPNAPSATANGDQRIDLAWTGSGAPGTTFTLERGQGTCASALFDPIATGLTTASFADTAVSGQVTYAYRIREVAASGECASEVSTCVEAATTGACTAAPAFAGVEQATTPGTTDCFIDLGWHPPGPACAGPVTFNVYRSRTSGFTPEPANRLATGVATGSFRDLAPNRGDNFYVVRALDTSNGAEDPNTTELVGVPTGPPADGTFASGAEPNEILFDLSAGGTSLFHVAWHTSTARFHGGARSYFSIYENSYCAAATSPPLLLTAGQTPLLSFWSLRDIESGFDGGVVEISNDAGATWAPLNPTPPYPGTMSASSDACGLATGRAAFTGSNLTWTQHTVSLAAFAGLTVRLRFLFSTDGSQIREGWYVDDISVTHAQVPGACWPGLIFENGFEAGGTGNWGSD